MADLRDLGPEEGEFDYIFAHGLYSWIPADVRDRLLAVCRERLAPQGVAFVSYNVYPGPLPAPDDPRDSAVPHASHRRPGAAHRGSAPPARADSTTKRPNRVMEHGDDSLFHDDLAPINDPVWFHEFAAHAQRHGLQYLGEADSHKTFDPAMEQAAATRT